MSFSIHSAAAAAQVGIALDNQSELSFLALLNLLGVPRNIKLWGDKLAQMHI